jgi:arylsulfatase A-like enzyme
MTGEYAHTRLVTALGWRMSPAERTLADEFNDAGYRTGYIGKWHLYGGQVTVDGYSGREEGTKPVPPTHQGRWQHWRGFRLRNGPFDTYYFADDDPTPRKIEGYQTDGLFDLGMEFMDEADGENPFCCVISVEPPHPPFEVPEELEEKWLDEEIELPPNFRSEKHLEVEPAAAGLDLDDSETRHKVIRDRKLYYGMVENLDDNVGRLMGFLEEKGLAEETIVMLVADHGELNGSHGLRSKQYPYEESIGIPLIFTGPGVASGKSIEDPVCTEDLFPTLLGLAGIEPGGDPPGEDLSPLVQGQQQGLDRPGVLLQFVWEWRQYMPFQDQMWRGYRSRRYKYTALGGMNEAQPWQFFDLREDPFELNNLIDEPEARDLVRQHDGWMQERINEVGDEFPETFD